VYDNNVNKSWNCNPSDHQKIQKKPAASVEGDTVLSSRPGMQMEMIEGAGTDPKDAAVLAVLISAMANTEGGTILIGMKGRLVAGVRLSRKEKDDFSVMVDIIATRLISPKLNVSLLSMDFVSVRLRDEDDKYIIRIKVKPGSVGQYFLTHNIPDTEPALYVRKRKGPNHTKQIPADEALKLINGRRN